MTAGTGVRLARDSALAALKRRVSNRKLQEDNKGKMSARKKKLTRGPLVGSGARTDLVTVGAFD